MLTESTSSHGIRHPVRLLVEAQTMAEGGWSYREIGRRLGVAHSTVREWVDPVAKRSRAAHSDASRARLARENGAKPQRWGNERPEFLLARMQTLRDEVKLSEPAIARLMTFDYGRELSRHNVRDALERARSSS